MRTPPDILSFALSNDTYSKDGADFTTTEILKPPQLTYLATKGAPMDQVIYKSFMALIGTGIHAALEVGGAGLEGAIVEERFFHTFEIDGQEVRLGGKPDFIHDGLLNDFKAILIAGRPKYGDPKKEHYLQGLFNSWLAIKNGVHVDTACVEYIFRDWNYGTSKREADYPQRPNQPMPFALIDMDDIEKLIVDRLTLHVRARNGQNTLCTDEDRWKTPDTWAVKKPRNKRARKVFSDHASALVALKAGEILDHRPGQNVRCAGWCDYAHICQQNPCQTNTK